ncbi:FG-GAP repeat domain-containing protein [Streptomyces sp. NPDC088131]|uniref:FG-GAP repeat domain-containing protein n=1 Tax=Streptomyces sp. NPDC088131 TaxID=3365826 RepID=UPI00380E8B03
MRTHAPRRAMRLASTLVAAGLALTATPHALAADSSPTAMRLTAEQAKQLAANAQVDVYGDGTAEDGASDGAATPADRGTSLQDPSGGSAAKPKASGTAAAGTPVTFTKKSALYGVNGLGATVQAGSHGYFTVHGLATIQLHKADGSTTWSRSSDSLYADWGITPLRPWDTEFYPARVMMGYNAVSPFSPNSEQGYDTGDLTGDGVPDLVFSASVGMNPPTGVTIPGSKLTSGTMVTVLDGKSGKTLWSKVYAYARMVKIVDGTLLAADSPQLNTRSAADTTGALYGTRFSYADGALTPSSTWTYDTGEAGTGAWGALEDAGDGKIAASWNLSRTATTAARGRTLVLDTADGSVVWQTDSELYGRQLHLDAARGRIVALEQADPSDAVKYQIASYDLGSGRRITLDTRVNAFPTAMTIGDVTPGGGSEYAVSESTLDSSLFLNSSTVRVLSGSDGATVQWTHTTKRAPGNDRNAPATWHLDVVGGKLIAAAQDDTDSALAQNTSSLRYGSLTAFNAKGKIAWRQAGLNASPMFQQAYRSGGSDYVRTIDAQQNIHEYKLGNGRQQSLTPLQGDLSYAQAADLNGDKKPDVVAGGTSNGVWAWSGPSLVEGAPEELWKTTVPGAVHSVQTGDVTGDKKPEVIVAAETAVVVLDGTTGKVLATIDGGGQYVRSVTVADIDGKGKSEILVPTDALRAYKGKGKALWTYSAPASDGDVVFSDTVTGDGQVYTQYSSKGALDLPDAAENGVALDGAKGTVRWTADPTAPAEAADGRLHGALLDHAVFASPKIPYADGHAVVYTWLALTDPATAGDISSAFPHVVVEIRDGRTGELLHRTVNGGPWSHGNFFIDGEGGPLYDLSFGTFRGYGADGRDTSSSVVAPLRTAQFITGPGGRELVAGGLEGGVGVWDPSVLTSGWSFQSGLGSATVLGGRNYLAADLDGDGVDDMVSLNFDDHGVNRMAEELGGGVLSLNDAARQLAVYTLS